MKTILCSAFPGTGKSYFYQNRTNLVVLDSDSSKFDKSQFPGNYIKHIQNNLGKADVICISSHKEVRDALVAQNMFFTLIYPDVSLKDEYLQRFRERGDVDGFIKLIASNWDNWLPELRDQKHCKHIVLKSGEFLSDMVGVVMTLNKRLTVRQRLKAVAPYKPFRECFGIPTFRIFDNLDCKTFAEIARRCNVSDSWISTLMWDLEHRLKHPAMRLGNMPERLMLFKAAEILREKRRA